MEQGERLVVPLKIENLINAEAVLELILRNVLRMRHTSVEDDETIGFHLDEEEQLPVLVPVIDVRVLFDGIRRVKDGCIHEFGVDIRILQGPRREAMLLGNALELRRDGQGYAIQAGRSVAI